MRRHTQCKRTLLDQSLVLSIVLISEVLDHAAKVIRKVLGQDGRSFDVCVSTSTTRADTATDR